MGVPARELSDAELERQGLRAHETRHWMFLHGTAEQFRTHTRRMLELEQEYLRRHPQPLALQFRVAQLAGGYAHPLVLVRGGLGGSSPRGSAVSLLSQGPLP